MPAAGQIVLDYLVNETTSWTTIFTWSTDNELYHEARSQETDDVTFAQFREVDFRIRSTGNAVPTGLYVQYEEVEDDLVAKDIGE